MPRDLTDKEQKAVASLEMLAKRWPDTLKLFSAAGTLCVTDIDLGDGEFEDHVLATIYGISNDGGDPW